MWVVLCIFEFIIAELLIYYRSLIVGVIYYSFLRTYMDPNGMVKIYRVSHT